MILNYGGQEINLFGDGVPKIAPISLSGGLDSTSLMYLICKHFPQVELVPYTCRDLNAPLDADAAVEIVDWMRNEFPQCKIKDIEIFEFNDRTEDFVTFKECAEAEIQYPQFKGMRRTGISKIIQLDRISWKFMSNFPDAVRLDGMTRNPPAEEMKKWHFYQKAERRRDKEQPYIEEYRPNVKHAQLSIYQPYANVDKKFVSGVFLENNLMDSLYPLTRSCVGTARQTNNFTHVCGQCFWCNEKDWAWDRPIEKTPDPHENREPII